MDDYVIQDRKHQNLLIALVCAGAFIANLDVTIVNITLPALSREFGVSPGFVSWAALAYLLCEAGFMLPMGRLADMKGIKTVYLAGFTVFFAGSLACGLSTHISALIGFRAFQGIGGAMLFTVMMSFIPLYLPPARRVSAIGIVTMSAAAGVGLGPPIGGFISTAFGWRWIFFVNLPICAAALLAGYRFLPSRGPQITDRRFDFPGMILSFVAFVSFLFAVNRGMEWGWTSPAILTLLGLSLLSLALFIVREKKIDYPLIDINLFRSRVIIFGLLALSVSFMNIGGILFIMPFYLIEGRGLSAHIAGLVMIFLSVGQFIGPFTGKLSGKFGVIPVCLAGMTLCVVSFLLFTSLGHDSPVPYICLTLGLFSLSQGTSRAPNISIVMESAPPAEKNAMAAIVSLSRSLFIALGVLFYETIFSESIPRSISIDNKHIASVITHARELTAGFEKDFVFGIFVSLLAIVFMIAARNKSGA